MDFRQQVLYNFLYEMIHYLNFLYCNCKNSTRKTLIPQAVVYSICYAVNNLGCSMDLGNLQFWNSTVK